MGVTEGLTLNDLGAMVGREKSQESGLCFKRQCGPYGKSKL